MCVSKGQTGRERDRSQGEEVVGSAASFIAALMSPVTHRLETAVLFFPCLGQRLLFYIVTDSQYSPETHTNTHTDTEKCSCSLSNTQIALWFDWWYAFFYCLFRITEVEISPIFKKLWNCCKCSDWQAGTNSKIWTEQTLACWSGASFFFFFAPSFQPVSCFESKYEWWLRRTNSKTPWSFWACLSHTAV